MNRPTADWGADNTAVVCCGADEEMNRRRRTY